MAITKKPAAYSERLSPNIHVNTPAREVALVQAFGAVGLDPCSNASSLVGARVECWGARPRCAICGELGTHGLSAAFIDRCHAHRAKRIDKKDDPRVRQAVDELVLQDPRFGRDGLSVDWAAQLQPGEIVFLQPPYGTGIVPWIHKANTEASRGAPILGLLPGRFDTRWFRAMRAGAICWYGRRIPFMDMTRPEQKDTAKFPSVYVYWGDYDRFRSFFAEHGVVTPWLP